MKVTSLPTSILAGLTTSTPGLPATGPLPLSLPTDSPIDASVLLGSDESTGAALGLAPLSGTKPVSTEVS